MQSQLQVDTLYDADFYAWTQQQAEYLRSGKVSALDFENLAEEIESLGKQQRQELRSRLGILLGYLLKWHYQPQKRSSSWFYTILEQRSEILKHLQENPSLKPYLPKAIIEGYEKGLYLFGRETGIHYRKLPQSCPFSDEQIFEEPIDFPEPPSQRSSQTC
ncbi:DUF29 family protein [Synechococcales cyanobacterium C]|uniref:DUF29 family protein n=1 Tax=Petrachloros mirabilis ULC683 TaxID=2781853 RepID=A0A8K2A2F0_9CYAN|nr:DUF29 domain-containing protein [Petrachloros mirabilis]NCJ08357.1 DUF29 family protein [Petrachloros mirabilis ULC683]